MNDVQKIDNTYNRNYLRAEYNFAHASAQMASRWEQFAADGDRYNLQYRTANDGSVRPEHAALHGVTLPPSDPFWQSYFPPNGWNCRCTAVQVRKDKYPETPHDEAEKRAANALSRDHRGMFRFNPGIQRKTFPDYNPYTISRCRDCDIAKGKLSLAKVPENEICAACKFVHLYYERISRKLQSNVQPPSIEQYKIVHNGNVLVSPWHGENELSANVKLAKLISDKIGTKVYLLPRLDPEKPEQKLLRETLLPPGVILNKNPDFYIGGLLFEAKSMMNLENSGDGRKYKLAIENRIKSAKKQADNIILEIPEYVPRNTIHSTIINYLNRSHKDRVIIVKWNERLLMYDKN